MPGIVGSLPFTLVNGTIADANQVMADFNAIISGVNTNAAGLGANSDITSLNALTTPISAAQGGTGLTSPGTTGNVLTSAGTSWISAAPTPGPGNGPLVGPWQGVTDGSDAAPGMVGEFKNGQGSGPINTQTPGAGVQMSLGPGDWDVWGAAQFNHTQAIFTFSMVACGLSAVINNLGALPTLLQLNSTYIVPGTTINAAVVRVKQSTTAPIYLNLQANFPQPGATQSSSIRARRVR